jgi:hypothetical protein
VVDPSDGVRPVAQALTRRHWERILRPRRVGLEVVDRDLLVRHSPPYPKGVAKGDRISRRRGWSYVTATTVSVDGGIMQSSPDL